MRILLAAAIALAPYALSVLASAPAHACQNSYWDVASGTMQCGDEQYTGPKRTPNVPVCAKGGLNGTACTNCTQRLQSKGVDDAHALTQSWWDCGLSGAQPAVTNTPHCFVDNVPTGQPPDKCYGNYIPDGHSAKTVAAPAS